MFPKTRDVRLDKPDEASSCITSEQHRRRERENLGPRFCSVSLPCACLPSLIGNAVADCRAARVLARHCGGDGQVAYGRNRKDAEWTSQCDEARSCGAQTPKSCRIVISCWRLATGD